MSKKGENITKRKDGRWEARAIIGYDLSRKPIRRYFYAPTYSLAKQKRNEFLLDLHKEATPKKEEEILFSAVLFDFLDQVKNRTKESTFSRYQSIVSLHLLPALGQEYLKDLSGPRIERFTREKLQNGRMDQKGGLSPKRVRDILSVLKMAISYAQSQGYLSHFLKFSLPKNTKKKTEIFTLQEQKHLCDYLLSNQIPQSIGVLLTLYTGLRIGELCALQWKDIDLEHHTLSVHKTLQRICDTEGVQKTKILIGPPKTKQSERIIPLPSSLVALLRAHRNQIKDENAYVLTATLQYTEPSNYYVKYQKWLKDCGLCPHSFHALRHTFATRCIECGFDAKSLSELLGHADVNITLSRYVHPSMDLKRKSMERLLAFMDSQQESQSTTFAK